MQAVRAAPDRPAHVLATQLAKEFQSLAAWLLASDKQLAWQPKAPGAQSPTHEATAGHVAVPKPKLAQTPSESAHLPRMQAARNAVLVASAHRSAAHWA